MNTLVELNNVTKVYDTGAMGGPQRRGGGITGE
jgi:hypothetical protein